MSARNHRVKELNGRDDDVDGNDNNYALVKGVKAERLRDRATCGGVVSMGDGLKRAGRAHRP